MGQRNDLFSRTLSALRRLHPACEADILQRGRGYPSVDFKRGECSFCYACAQACTESLFLPRHTGHGIWFYAHGKLPRQQSVECHRCRDSCEPMAITFRPTLSGIYQPQLDSQACNGCGACGYLPRVSHQSGEPPCALTGRSVARSCRPKSEHRRHWHTVEHVAGLRSRVKRC